MSFTRTEIDSLIAAKHEWIAKKGSMTADVFKHRAAFAIQAAAIESGVDIHRADIVRRLCCEITFECGGVYCSATMASAQKTGRPRKRDYGINFSTCIANGDSWEDAFARLESKLAKGCDLWS